MTPTGIGVPNVMLIGDGNLPWRPPVQRSALDRTYEAALRNLRKVALKSRKLLAPSDNEKHPATSIYVVSDILGGVSKIGRAHCPSSRLSRIQTGNPDELFLHRVFWVDKGQDAIEVERRSHELAGPYGRLMGEWFCCKPNEAHALIVRVLNEMNIDYVAITPVTKLGEAP